MLTTSFANEIDTGHIAAPISARDFARGMTSGKIALRSGMPAAAPAKTPRLGVSFTRSAANDAHAMRRKNGSSEDGMIGSFILSTLFFGAYPSLAFAFNGMAFDDMAEIYDQARSAFAPRKKQPMKPVATAPVPTPFIRRRPRSLLSLILG